MQDKNLKQNKIDILSSTAKSIVGIVPFAGPVLSELISALIPNQRIDRLTNYIIELEKKLSTISDNNLRELLTNEECLDLFEESFIQASRTINKKRQIQIASVVQNGLNETTISYSNSKYIMRLLQELNEQEVIWLRFYLIPTIGGDEQFREKHKDILETVFVTIGADEETRIKAAIQDSYIEHLERLGLIKSHYNINNDTNIPEYDEFSGKPSVSYRDITTLGRLLLKQIDLIDKI